MSSGVSTAIAPTCAAIGIAAAAVAVPMPAPATVPRLNAACSRGISERPSRRSTSAPSTFIDTSHTPMPSPTSTSPAVAGATVPSASPSAVSPRLTPSVTAPPRAAEPVPNRCTIGPDSGRPATDPADMQSRSRPSCAVVSPSASRTAGVREANDANAMPLVANVTTTAVRARSRP